MKATEYIWIIIGNSYKYRPGLNKYSYCEQLLRFNLPSLQLRRLPNDVVRCYKILFGYVDMRANDFFLNQTF